MLGIKHIDIEISIQSRSELVLQGQDLPYHTVTLELPLLLYPSVAIT